MTNQHPIIPPLALIDQWWDEAKQNAKYDEPIGPLVATKAAQWGADQQLAEDAKWLDQHALDAPHLKITPVGESLIEAMRSKPLTLNSIALQMLGTIERDAHYIPEITDTIRRALEALDD